MPEKQSDKEKIIEKLKANGCRITKQRLEILDIILENECTSCKEIYYKAAKLDSKIGTATVYRLINILEEIGAISRKNMYRVTTENAAGKDACIVELSDHTTHYLSAKKWNTVLQAGLRACGYLTDQQISSIKLNPCEDRKRGI